MSTRSFQFFNRYVIRLAPASILILIAVAAVPHQMRTADFTLKARVLEAMENGPVVVEATRIYGGKEPLKIHVPVGGDCFVVDRQPRWHWESVIRSSSYIGTLYGLETLAVGERLTALQFVHQDYSAIPPGKVNLRIRWPIYEPGELGKLIAVPVNDIVVEVNRATPENLAALGSRFEKELKRADLTSQCANYIADCLIRTRHKELSKVAIKVFDCPIGVSYLKHQLLGQIRLWFPDPREANEFILRHVIRPDALRPLMPFGFRQWDDHRFTDEQVQLLRETLNPWVRMLTSVTFPKQCPEKWKADLLAEMGRLAELPAAVENLRLLDHPQFAVREKATVRLVRWKTWSSRRFVFI